jgi:hypothetical protein
MMKNQIKKSVKIDYVNDEVLIYDVETGFSGKGNKYAYLVLSMLSEPTTAEEIIRKLKERFSENQHNRIEKSVPNIILWAEERGLLDSGEN